MSTEASQHEHKWLTSMHLDGCHFYTSGATCVCGASLTLTYERRPMADPYSRVWMEPQVREVTRDARGRFVKPHYEEIRCARCEELQRGVPTKADLVVVLNDGTVEREEHLEYSQDPEEDENDECDDDECDERADPEHP
jgi:hypothetical protein